MPNIGRLENLPPEKRELLSRLFRRGRGSADELQRRAAGMDRVPVSYGQRRIWFLDQLEPGLPVYQISTALDVWSALDPVLLERSVNTLVERHESLRTTFSEIDGELFQVVADHAEMVLHFADLTSLSSAQQLSEATRIGSADASEPFNLATGPLLRVTLIQMDENHSVLLLTLHHIISDGWSMNVLLKELSLVYGALAQGEQPQLPELPIQYADYALWQQEHLTTEVLGKELAYWREQLNGAATLQLPVDYPGVRRTHPGAREFFGLNTAQTRRLEQISRSSGATLFMVLLAAFDVLLGRYSGQDDIVVGTPVAERTRPETAGLIGFLLNTVCIRINLKGDPDFLTLLERVRQTAVNAYAHQEVPFDKVVEAIAPGNSLNGSALFNVMFVFQALQGWRHLGDSAVLPPRRPLDWQFENGTAKFDLTLSMADTAEGLVGALEYNTNMFRASTARRMVQHFTTLIDSILAESRSPISKLKILTPTEEDQILHRWNATVAPFRDDARVEQLVAEQANRLPSATAVIYDTGQITYRALCREANQVAHYLLNRRVECGSRVGIFLERGRRLLPAILGAWAAGCSYVPLDCESPVERTRFILEDAGLATVLTEEGLVERLPVGAWGLVCLDTEEENISRESEGLPGLKNSCEDTAYIIYTSGSTGQPKGVMVTHRSLVNYLTWVNRVVLGAPPRLLPAITKITFDASLKQLFGPLLRGDPVWLIAEGLMADLAELARMIGNRGDFALNCVPWLWNSLLETLSTGVFSATRHLKKLLVGGEEFSPELLERTFTQFPSLEVWNLYGPTETTANATAQRLYPGKEVSIGRPIANCTVRVLDAHNQLVPVGIAGELHIGGTGVASGYWRRPELTKKRFIPDPFALQAASCRLYKTGDVVRYCEDGSLIFKGRIDRQIKIHGYRVEPGEIEAVLSSHPAVRDVVVVLTPMDYGPLLVAYIEMLGRDKLSASELRLFAIESLPAYMVPSHFVSVNGIPRNAHGKIDLAALPPLRGACDGDAASSLAPRDDYERGISAIWEAVLTTSCVDVQTNFFELGGHSLLAMQVMSRIRQKFAVEVPLRALFEAPTVEALALIVRKSKENSSLDKSRNIPRLSRDAKRIHLDTND